LFAFFGFFAFFAFSRHLEQLHYEEHRIAPVSPYLFRYAWFYRKESYTWGKEPWFPLLVLP
jgi:hypothetical protein